MKDVSKWFSYEDSTTQEKQVKYYIASTIEGYLNGCYDDNYAPMTKAEYIAYVWDCLKMDANSGIIVNGNESKHLMFAGREEIEKLTAFFVDNYEDVQKYLIK
jgi:hypothetical protein